jgi:hypothetical protein
MESLDVTHFPTNLNPKRTSFSEVIPQKEFADLGLKFISNFSDVWTVFLYMMIIV